MSDTITGENTGRIGNVKEVLGRVLEMADDIDHVIVLFQPKKGGTLGIGMDADAPTSWLLSALGWCQWHVYYLLDKMRQGQEMFDVMSKLASEDDGEDEGPVRYDA